MDASISTGPITAQVHVGANKILFLGMPGGPMARVGTVEEKTESMVWNTNTQILVLITRTICSVTDTEKSSITLN